MDKHSQLIVLLVPAVFTVSTLVPSLSNAQLRVATCMQTICKRQEKSCKRFLRVYFQEKRAQCADAGGQKNRRRCRRTERRDFDGDLRRCRKTYRACRACCRGEPGWCERAVEGQCDVMSEREKLHCELTSRTRYAATKLGCAEYAGLERKGCQKAARVIYKQHIRACKGAFKANRKCCSLESPADCIVVLCGDG